MAHGMKTQETDFAVVAQGDRQEQLVLQRSPQLKKVDGGYWHSLDAKPWFKIEGPFEQGRIA